MRHFFSSLARFEDNVALIAPAEGRVVSYWELDALVAARREKLPETRGFVFIQAGNTIASVVNYLAVLSANHPTLLMESFETEKGRGLLEVYRPNLLLKENEVIQHSAEPVALHPELAILMSTSGSTGTPKLVKLSRSNLHSNTMSIVKYLKLTEADKAFCHLKPYYSFGMSILNSHLACGGSVVLSEHSMIDEKFWKDMLHHEATSFSGVPYNFETLKRHGFRPSDFPDLRYATQAGGKLDADLVRHFSETFRFAGKEFFVMYGQTEAAPRMSYLPPDQAFEYPNSIGRAVPGGKLYLIDEQGREVGDIGREGELAYEGPNVMMGYATSRDELSGDETPPRLLTGDIACRLSRDPKGDIFQIVGRTSRFVKPFGVRLGLDEVQSYVKVIHPVSAATGTDDLLVIGLEGQEDAVLQERVLSSCAERFSLPRSAIRVLFFSELPLLSTGKVDYRGVLDAAYHTEKPGFLQLVKSMIYEALGFGTNRSETVGEAFCNILQIPSVSTDQSFEKLGADSLSYVALSLELANLMGDVLPEYWTTMSVGELEYLHQKVMLRNA